MLGWHYIEGTIQSWIHTSMNVIHLHPWFGLFFAFLISFSESLPVLGSIIPGSITMTAVGTLIGTGILPAGLTLSCAVVGAFFGDFVGFYLGYRYHASIHTTWFFQKYPQLISKGEAFFERHGGKGIVLGRFVGPLRSAIPMVAGILRMKPWRFTVAAVPSAVLWALLYTVPGIALGALSTDLPKTEVTRFLIGGIIIIALLWALLWLIKHLLRRVYRAYRHGMHARWHRMQAKPTWLFQKLHRPTQPDQDLPLRLMLTGSISALCFFALFLSLTFSTLWQPLNQSINLLLQSFRHPIPMHLAQGISLLGDKATLIIVVALFSCFLAAKRAWHALSGVWLSTLSIVLLTGFIKWVHFSPRPTSIVHPALSSSFPSGHVALTLSIYGMIAAILCFEQRIYLKLLASTLVGLLVFCIGLSRLYLGMHWFSDTLGSLFLGYAVLNFSHAVWLRTTTKACPSPSSLLALALSIVLAWLTTSHLYFDQRLAASQLLHPSYQLSETTWWTQARTLLPAYRQSRTGRHITPLNIQWAAPLKAIQAQLTALGWQNKRKLPHLKGLLNRLTRIDPISHMPLLPQLYLNQKPVLLMIRPTQKTDHAVLELRLWAAATHFKNSSTPLWVGTLQYHMPPHKLMALTRKQRSHYATENALSQLRETLATAHFASRYVPLPPPQHHKQNPHDGTKILQVRAAHNMLDTLRQ